MKNYNDLETKKSKISKKKITIQTNYKFPRYVKIPKIYQDLFNALFQEQDLKKKFEIYQDFHEKKVKNTKVKYNSNVYIPKYNTFEKEENFDLHAELGDEKYDMAKLPNNILRSRGLKKQFKLRLEDFKEYFEHHPDISHQKHLFNYSHLDLWNEEQLDDIERQLEGEKEEILLTMDSLYKEIEYLKSFDELKSSIIVEDESEFWSGYLIYIRALDYVKREKKDEIKLVTNPPTTPLSFEMIGFFSETYFIPWKKYKDFIEFEKVKFPWEILSLENLKDMNGIYTRENRMKGLELMEKSDEITRMKIEDIEREIGRKHQFYELEIDRFAERSIEEKEKKEMFIEFQRLSEKKRLEEKILKFTSMLQEK